MRHQCLFSTKQVRGHGKVDVFIPLMPKPGSAGHCVCGSEGAQHGGNLRTLKLSFLLYSFIIPSPKDIPQIVGPQKPASS